MGAVSGIGGSVSWGSSGVQFQLAGGGGTPGTKPGYWTLNLDGDEYDAAGFSDVGVPSELKGLQGWSVEFGGQLYTPDHGASGSVTYAAGLTTIVTGWAIEAARDEHPSTALQATSKAYVPGKYRWSGSLEELMDDATALVAVNNASEPAALTAKYQEKGGTDNQFTGSIFTTGATASVSPGALNAVTYRFRGTGALSHATPSAGAGIVPAGSLALQAAETLRVTAASGKYAEGSAFWTSISIACKVGQLTEFRVRARGTGALTLA